MCLICGGAVEDGRATPSDAVAFSCARHGEHMIARAALARFMRLPVEAKATALDRAKVFARSRNGKVTVTALEL